jgi:NAD-dependent DNA ligase
MRELDGDMTDEQLASWQAPQQQQQQQDGIRTAGADAQQQQQQEQQQQQVEELALMSFVRAGAFSKLCRVCKGGRQEGLGC